MSRNRSAALALSCFLLGVALMIPFEEWYTRLFGMAFLLAAIVGGAFVVAEPGFLASDEDGE